MQGTHYEASDGSSFEPLYRHPASDPPAMQAWSPFVARIRALVAAHVGHPINHALIQLYRSGADFISEHSDKTLDIMPKSCIVNFSLGATRAMVLKLKKETVAHRAAFLSACPKSRFPKTQKKHEVMLPNNSLFVFGLQSNQFMTHSIKRDKRPESAKGQDELAFGGERISITFRHIGSFVRRKHALVVGMGAPNPWKAVEADEEKRLLRVEGLNKKVKLLSGDAGKDSRSKTEQKLLVAFSKENQQGASFDWQEAYGAGFSIAHLTDDSAELQSRKERSTFL